MARPTYWGGDNIAMKVPQGKVAQVRRFYQSILGFEPHPLSQSEGAAFRFGQARDPAVLWIDSIPEGRMAEVWLEVRTAQLEAAEADLTRLGIRREDDVEPLPPGYRGFWVRNPVGIVHLISEVGA